MQSESSDPRSSTSEPNRGEGGAVGHAEVGGEEFDPDLGDRVSSNRGESTVSPPVRYEEPRDGDGSGGVACHGCDSGSGPGEPLLGDPDGPRGSPGPSGVVRTDRVPTSPNSTGDLDTFSDDSVPDDGTPDPDDPDGVEGGYNGNAFTNSTRRDDPGGSTANFGPGGVGSSDVGGETLITSRPPPEDEDREAIKPTPPPPSHIHSSVASPGSPGGALGCGSNSSKRGCSNGSFVLGVGNGVDRFRVGGGGDSVGPMNATGPFLLFPSIYPLIGTWFAGSGTYLLNSV